MFILNIKFIKYLGMIHDGHWLLPKFHQIYLTYFKYISSNDLFGSGYQIKRQKTVDRLSV